MVALDLVLGTCHSGGFGMLSENMMNRKFKHLGRSVKHTSGEDTSTWPYLELKAGSGRNCIVNFRDFTIFADNYAWHHADQTKKIRLFLSQYGIIKAAAVAYAVVLGFCLCQ